jgi:hypothetical protein
LREVQPRFPGNRPSRKPLEHESRESPRKPRKETRDLFSRP